MAQALKEKALEVALLEQKVRQLQLLLELQQALIPISKPVSADTPPLVEDDQDHPVEDPQVEDHPQEDLEVQVATHPEHQDLLHQYCYDPPQFFSSLSDPLLVTISNPLPMAKRPLPLNPSPLPDLPLLPPSEPSKPLSPLD